MEFTIPELALMLSAIKEKRVKPELDFIKAMEISHERHDKDEFLIVGVAETFEILQKFNNLIIKLEEELRRKTNDKEGIIHF